MPAMKEAATAPTPEDNPSITSIRLNAFVIASTQSTVSGISIQSGRNTS